MNPYLQAALLILEKRASFEATAREMTRVVYPKRGGLPRPSNVQTPMAGQRTLINRAAKGGANDSNTQYASMTPSQPQGIQYS